MKPRWHLLFLFLSIATAYFVEQLLSRPLWEIEDARFVCFDQCHPERKEWSVLVGDPDKKHWWIETRYGRDATVARQLQLELLPVMGSENYYSLRGSLLSDDKSDAIICCRRQEDAKPASGISVSQVTYILDPGTGKCLRKFSTIDHPIGKIATHGNKVAFFEGENLILYDVSKKTEKSLHLANTKSLTFSPNGKLLACIADTNVLTLIDWDQGTSIEPLSNGKYVGSFFFLSNNTLLIAGHSIADWGVHRRWRWNGSSLIPISPGIKLPNHTSFIDAKPSADGTLHLGIEYLVRWPARVDSIFQWLTEKGVPVERWFPKSLHKLCVVLNEQDQILLQYFEMFGQDRSQRIKLYDQWEIDFERQQQRTAIRLWSNSPTWPNAIAAGLLIYLGLDVLIRCITLNQNKPALTP